jgi:hypothetical protein
LSWPNSSNSRERIHSACPSTCPRLDFRQSLDPELFARAAEKEALSYARLHLRGLLADGTVVTLQSLRQ